MNSSVWNFLKVIWNVHVNKINFVGDFNIRVGWDFINRRNMREASKKELAWNFQEWLQTRVGVIVFLESLTWNLPSEKPFNIYLASPHEETEATKIFQSAQAKFKILQNPCMISPSKKEWTCPLHLDSYSDVAAITVPNVNDILLQISIQLLFNVTTNIMMKTKIMIQIHI